MCGRFTRSVTTEAIVDEFGISEVKDNIQPSYNIAPGQNVAAIIEDKSRKLGLLRWGLIPRWAKDAKIGNRMINARAETLTEKPSFKDLIKRNRCLIVADGFFEWKSDGEQKKPIYVFMKNQNPFAFAGLWDIWRSPEGKKVSTCTIITTGPNSLLKNIHKRMPVILQKQDVNLWLDRKEQDEKKMLPLLKPYPAGKMGCHEVSRAVNSPENNTPEIIRKL